MWDCCCIDIDETVTLLADEARTARKSHKCGECGATIAPGERYTIERWVYDGAVGGAKTCLPCRAIRRDFFPCGCYYGRMREDFYECHGFDYTTGPQFGDPAWDAVEEE